MRNAAPRGTSDGDEDPGEEEERRQAETEPLRGGALVVCGPNLAKQAAPHGPARAHLGTAHLDTARLCTN